MPFVQRDASGAIHAVFATSNSQATEELSSTHPALLDFLGGKQTTKTFNQLDIEFIRVLEDLVDVLIERGILRLTDLPSHAQEKLLGRQSHRAALKNSKGMNILSDDETI